MFWCKERGIEEMKLLTLTLSVDDVTGAELKSPTNAPHAEPMWLSTTLKAHSLQQLHIPRVRLT